MDMTRRQYRETLPKPEVKPDPWATVRDVQRHAARERICAQVSAKL